MYHISASTPVRITTHHTELAFDEVHVQFPMLNSYYHNDL